MSLLSKPPQYDLDGQEQKKPYQVISLASQGPALHGTRLLSRPQDLSDAAPLSHYAAQAAAAARVTSGDKASTSAPNARATATTRPKTAPTAPPPAPTAGSQHTGPAFTFPTAPKANPSSSSQAASPGPYLGLATFASNQAYTIQGARTSAPGAAASEGKENLGPGAYLVVAPGSGGPAYSFPMAGVLPPEPVESDGAPYYYGKMSGYEPTGQAWTMGAKREPVEGEGRGGEGPGPGSYAPPLLTQSGAAFTIAGRNRSSEGADPRNAVSAPLETYVTADKDPRISKGPAFTFGARPKSAAKAPEGPCIGQYNPQIPKSSPAFSLGLPIRRPASPAKEVPGPGAYSVPCSLGGPAVTIAGRPKSPKERDTSPGPIYDVKVPVDAPAFTMGRRFDSPGSRKRKEDAFLAPGCYDLVELDKGPAFTIAGRAPTPKKERDESPGPGQYAPDLYAPPAGPAFTIAGKPAPPKQAEPTPSPLDYAPVLPPSGAAFTIAGKIPEKPRRSESPGPAAYHVQLPSDAPAFSIAGKAPMDPAEKEAAATPGPGHVTPRLPMDAPAFTIAGRPKSPKKARDTSPGPIYDPAPVPKGPAFTIGSRIEVKEDREDMPGPQDTAPPLDLKPSTPAWTMPARPKEKGGREDGPSPLDYDPRDPSEKRGPAWTLAGRPGEPRQAEEPTPSPLDYNPVVPSSAAAFTMGAKLPEKGKEADGPGPGTYQVTRPSDGPAFTMYPRFPAPEDPVSNADGPHPMTYRVPSPDRGPAYTIAGRTRAPKTERDASPGPIYDPAPVPQGPAFTLGKRIEVKEDRDDMPGPQDTAPPLDLKPSTPAWTMPARPKDKGAKEDGPSPLDYDPRDPSERKGPAWTLAGKGAEPKEITDPTPSPLDYNPVVPSTAVAWTMGAKLPEKSKETDLPGPTTYRVPGPAPGPAFTMYPRFPAPEDPVPNADGPHPMTYRVPSPDRGPAFTIQGRTPAPKTERDASPGPIYDPPEPPKGPAFTLGKRIEVVEPREKTPSPLDTAPPLDLKPSTPAWTMPARAKEPSAKDQGPSPLDYDPKYPREGKAFTIGAKLPPPKQPGMDPDLPGVGEYDIPPLAPSTPAFTIGAKKGPAAAAPSDTPGPGDFTFDVPVASGPAYTLGFKGKGPSIDRDAPGPGTYRDGGYSSTGAAYTMGKRTAYSGPESTPAPGDYVVPVPRDAIAFTFQGTGLAATNLADLQPKPGTISAAQQPSNSGGVLSAGGVPAPKRRDTTAGGTTSRQRAESEAQGTAMGYGRDHARSPTRDRTAADRSLSYNSSKYAKPARTVATARAAEGGARAAEAAARDNVREFFYSIAGPRSDVKLGGNRDDIDRARR